MTEQVAESIPLPAPDPKGQLPRAKLPITLRSLRLSYFAPSGPTDTPPAGSGAWLIPNLFSIDDSSANCLGSCYLHFLKALPAGQVTLSFSGHRPEDATVIPGIGADQAGQGVLPNGYVFAVPARLTHAILTIHPKDIPATPA